jgi:YD repeat-containing protein
VSPSHRTKYIYDESGNLLKDESVIDPITGRLLRQGEIEFTYDALGRLSEKRSPVSQTTYAYDSESYLIGYSKTEADHEIRLRFTYDPLGRRVTKHFKSFVVSLSNHGRSFDSPTTRWDAEPPNHSR